MAQRRRLFVWKAEVVTLSECGTGLDIVVQSAVTLGTAYSAYIHLRGHKPVLL